MTIDGARWASEVFDQRCVIGRASSTIGDIPKVAALTGFNDLWGEIKVRCGIGRMDYAVIPGLYAVNSPDSSSPVFVTANYKLSFDKLRKALSGIDGWILVLDTAAVNVWCAAGKGSFGTDELVDRIAASRLAEIVEHRRLILPQLGAPGVAGHEVKKRAGFKVDWGPIQASDIAAYLAAGRQATPEMRRKAFTLGERAVLIPIELAFCFRYLMLSLVLIFVVSGIGFIDDSVANVMLHGLRGALALLVATVSGAVVTPLLLPWLPGRAFAVKGAFVAMVAGSGIVIFAGDFSTLGAGLETMAWLIIAIALAAFLAMNFTGASTFTSLSGVREEMRRAVPFEISGAVLGLVMWISSFWIH